MLLKLVRKDIWYNIDEFLDNYNHLKSWTLEHYNVDYDLRRKILKGDSFFHEVESDTEMITEIIEHNFNDGYYHIEYNDKTENIEVFEFVIEVKETDIVDELDERRLFESVDDLGKVEFVESAK